MAAKHSADVDVGRRDVRRVEDPALVTGAAHGQGHETAWAQLASRTLGVSLESVHVIDSDTARAPRGPGTMGSRSLQVGGSAVLAAARPTLEAARRLAAHLLEADVRDVVVVLGSGIGVAGTPGAVLSWAALAQAANDPDRRPPNVPPVLAAHEKFSKPDAT